MPAPYRTVREDDAFTRAIQQIQRRYPRIREVEGGVSWLLARAPEQYYKVPGTHYHLYRTANLGALGDQALLILYKFDDDMVYLIDARLV